MNEIIEKLPICFQTQHTSKCACCGQTERTEPINYQLKLEFLRHLDLNGKIYICYKLYYEPTFYYSHTEKPQIIGENTGMGERDINILVDKLVEKLKELKVIKENK